jgi:hypothetical protein
MRFEYRTEVLTSMVGRDKLRVGDLEDTLRKFGDEGWIQLDMAALTRPDSSGRGSSVRYTG